MNPDSKQKTGDWSTLLVFRSPYKILISLYVYYLWKLAYGHQTDTRAPTDRFTYDL